MTQDDCRARPPAYSAVRRPSGSCYRAAVTRLDSFIRRLQAQRVCLDWACARIAGVPGVVLELGLGNGRTYDHLRDRLGDRRDIHAFDRRLAAHPACRPPANRLILGELRETLPIFAGGKVALAHADLGSGDTAATAGLAAWLGPSLVPFLAPNAIVLCDQPLRHPSLKAVAVAGIHDGRYFAYQMTKQKPPKKKGASRRPSILG